MMGRTHRIAAWAVLWGLGGCGGEAPSASSTGEDSGATGGPRPAAALVDVAAWAEDPAADPLPAHRPAGATCAPSGWGREGSSLEVETGLCPYAVFAQPALADLRPGEEVELVLWHKDLVAEEPAEAHVLVSVGDVVLFDRRVPIPSGPEAYTETVTVQGRAAAGDPVVWHLHNHGANSWNLLSVDRRATTTSP